MLYVIISKTCPACIEQVNNIKESGLSDSNVTIIDIDSKEFESFSENRIVDSVPFLVSVNSEGKILSVASGLVSNRELLRLTRTERPPPFNLKTARSNK